MTGKAVGAAAGPVDNRSVPYCFRPSLRKLAFSIHDFPVFFLLPEEYGCIKLSHESIHLLQTEALFFLTYRDVYR